MKQVALITDFGNKDWYAKVLSGVITNLCPQATIIDITHQVPPGNIPSAAFILENAYRYFPDGTVFVCVVDPGVGSTRTPLIVKTRQHVFIAPDNGVLSNVLTHSEPLHIHCLENPAYRLSPVSPTFHGRDVFAPAAAHYLNGVPLESFGPEQSEINILPWPSALAHGNKLQGEIIYIDHFGNCFTSITASDLAGLPKGEQEVVLPTGEKLHLSDFYQQTPLGQPLALIGSGGYLEISLNGGHAAHSLPLRLGDSLTVQVIGSSDEF